MSELSPRVQNVLDAARSAGGPTSEDRVRVRAALAARLGTAGAGALLATKQAAAMAPVATTATTATATTATTATTAASATTATVASATTATTATTAAVTTATVGATAVVGAKTSVFAALLMSAAVATGAGVGAGIVLGRRHAAPTQGTTVSTREAATASATRESATTSAARERGAARRGVPSDDAIALAPSEPVSAAPGALTPPAEPAPVVAPAAPVIVHTAPVAAHARASAQSHARVLAPGATTIATARPNPLGEELTLLRGAQDALRTHDGATALGLLEQHAARFPQGMLREERLATRVLALCQLGRASAAQDAARVFLSSYPHSPYAVRVRASCVGQNP